MEHVNMNGQLYRRFENSKNNYIFCTLIPRRCYHYINGERRFSY